MEATGSSVPHEEAELEFAPWANVPRDVKGQQGKKVGEPRRSRGTMRNALCQESELPRLQPFRGKKGARGTVGPCFAGI